MKTLGHALPVALIVVALTVGSVGCATYKYTQQKDSATIRGTDQGPEAMALSMRRPEPQFSPPVVYPVRIDGLVVMARFPAYEHFVSPGKHQVGLRGWALGLGYFDGTVEAEFGVSHSYRFTTPDGYSVTLSDETISADKPITVGTWTLSSEEEDSDNEPLVVADFDGVQYASPPFHPGVPDRGDKHGPPESHPGGPGGSDRHAAPPSHAGPPSGGEHHTPSLTHAGPPGGGGNHAPSPPHAGGPPSIPHEPRPNPGNGGHNDDHKKK